MADTSLGKRRHTILRKFGKSVRRWVGPQAVVLGAALFAVVMVVLCIEVLYEARLDARHRAEEVAQNLALVAERDIVRNFELYALSLQAVIEGTQDANVMALPPSIRGMVLFDRSATAKYLGSVLVLDASGNIAIDSASDRPRHANFSDRKYFTVHRDNPDVGLYISDPFKSRLRGGTLSITLSRRLANPDGSFAGIAMITINLDYFHDLFAGLVLGEHGAISLIGNDGVMVMRQPYDPTTIGRDISRASTFLRFKTTREAMFADVSTIDGVKRLYYFKQLPSLPLILMVAQAETDIYARWRRRALPVSGLMVALALGFVVLSMVLSTQLRRRLRAESELHLLARVDGLTGLNNRRTLGEILDREWQQAHRTRCAFSLLFADIDHFKSYNDTYGHQAGDKALLEVAHCISENIRLPTDSAARYGGEEFIVVLPDTTANGAAQIAERIRSAIAALGIEHAGSEFGRVTASIGLATWNPEGGNEADVRDVIKAADKALYTAKATGRNKVAQTAAVTVD